MNLTITVLIVNGGLTDMPKRVERIEVPLSLCRLLVAEPADITEGVNYEDAQKVAKALLKVLIEASGK